MPWSRRYVVSKVLLFRGKLWGFRRDVLLRRISRASWVMARIYACTTRCSRRFDRCQLRQAMLTVRAMQAYEMAIPESLWPAKVELDKRRMAAKIRRASKKIRNRRKNQ